MGLNHLLVTAILCAVLVMPPRLSRAQFFASSTEESEEEGEESRKGREGVLPSQTGRFMGGWGRSLWDSFFGDAENRRRDESYEESSEEQEQEDDEDGRLISPVAFSKITETLGALNNVGRLLVNMTRGQEVHPGEVVPDAILTFTKNVLGQNVSKTFEPLIKKRVDKDVELPHFVNKKKVNRVTKDQLVTAAPPADPLHSVFSDQNSLEAEAKDSETRCLTPQGKAGHCDDLRNCPALLLDLSHLRESICFKSLFVPGVCCPISESTILTTQRPLKLTTRATSRPSLILRPQQEPAFLSTAATTTTTTTRSTKRPSLLPVFLIDKDEEEEEETAVSNLGPLSGNYVDSDDCGQQEYDAGRIVGGVAAPVGKWPWMAAIFLHGAKRTEFWCGGSLIGVKYVLTAAHCTRDSRQRPFAAKQFTVRLGDIDLASEKEDSAPATYKVKEVRAHPRFSRVGFYNDIAVMVLEQPVRKSRFVIPVCLPKPTLNKARLPGRRAVVVGWGTQFYGGKESTSQRQATLPIWRNEDCNRAYFQPITDNFLCAGYSEGGVDACQGDSGGPLMMEIEKRWTQLGIVSFGNKCGEPGYPGVYTRISEYLEWIRDNTKN